MIDDRLPMDTLELQVDPHRRVAHIRFLHPGRPVMTRRLIEDFSTAQRLIHHLQERSADGRASLRYLVVSSKKAGVFSLGGDLELFLSLIERRDRKALTQYARTCVELLHHNLHGKLSRLCSISVVEGEALGGGFETALGADVLIAERRARFGFPELQFGLFPGMGAFQLLARRIEPALARRMITSGRIYTAEELHEMGVVDYLAEDGHAHELLNHYIDRRRDREGGYAAVDALFNAHTPISREALVQSVDLWVETALALGPKNLSMMRYLLKAQQRRWPEKDARRVARLRA